MSGLILKICEHCKYKHNSNASLPCRECSSRSNWEVAETITVRSEVIEAQQQEIQQLKESFRKYGDAAIQKGFLFEEVNLDNIRMLQGQNDQLQAQAARMREALELAESRFKVIEQATEYVKPNTGVWHTVGIALQEIKQFKQAISTTPTDYHNPADVAEIERLKKLVDHYEKALMEVEG